MNVSSLGYLNPRNVLDIGAFTGQWASEAAKIWPDANFFLIEGNRDCEPMLKDSGKFYRIALLGDTRRNVTYFKQRNAIGTGNSYYKEQTQFFENCEEETRELVPLSDIVSEKNRFDFAKIDVQGAELDVLKGGRSVFEKCSSILIEVAAEGSTYNENAPSMKEIINFMHDIGFDKYRIIEDIPHPVTRQIIQHDLLFEK